MIILDVIMAVLCVAATLLWITAVTEFLCSTKSMDERVVLTIFRVINIKTKYSTLLCIISFFGYFVMTGCILYFL